MHTSSGKLNQVMRSSIIPIGLLPLLLSLGCGETESTAEFSPLTADDVMQQVQELERIEKEKNNAPPEPRNEPGPVDKDAPEEFTETKSGLRYRIRRKSEGRKPTASDEVLVYYHGTLDDGTVFDSSYSRGVPDEFSLRNVIAGWREGLKLVGVGGMIELEVPPELGYGDDGQGSNIPPNATLHFVVELMNARRLAR